MKSRASLAFVLFVMISLSCTGQTILEFPVCLNRPVNEYFSDTLLSHHPDGMMKGKPWKVYAAKDHIVGYKDEILNTAAATFMLMDAFYVLEERSDKVKVLEAAFFRFTTLQDGWYSHIYWFRKSDMLLWTDCLIHQNIRTGNNVTDLPMKGFYKNEHDPFPAIFYSGPDRAILERKDTVNDVTVLFIYKKENEFYLIGTKPRLSETNFKDEIKGWLPKNYFMEWNSQLALEVNWESCHDRQNGNTSVKIFSSPDAARNYSINSHYIPPPGLSRIIFKEDPAYCKRAPGTLHRFYLLDPAAGGDQQIMKVGVVGGVVFQDLYGRDYCIRGYIPGDDVAAIRDRLVKGFNQISEINIIFVIEGNRGMEQYYQSLLLAFSSTMRTLMERNNYEDNYLQFRFGALIYPGRSEGIPFQSSNKGNWTNDIDEIQDFFRDAMVPINTISDLNPKETLFSAIEQALEIFKVNPLNSNYLVLIGDKVNNTASHPEITQGEITDLLDKNNFNLYAFQVHNRMDEGQAYADFQEQVTGISQDMARNRLGRLWTDYDSFLRYCQRGSDPFAPVFAGLSRESDPGNVYVIYNRTPINDVIIIDPKMCPIYSQSYFARDSLSVLMLKTELDSTFLSIASETEDFMDVLGQAYSGNGTEIPYQARVLDFCLKQGLTFEESMYMLKPHVEQFEVGYTCNKPSWSNDALFNYVSVSNYKAIQVAEDLFSHIFRPGAFQSMQAMRSNFYHEWEELLCHDVKIVSAQEFNDLSLGQAMTFLTGMPAPEGYNYVRFKDVLNPNLYPDVVFLEHCVDMIIVMGQFEGLLDSRNVINPSYLKSYGYYILQYLSMKDTDDEPCDISPDRRDEFFVHLAYKLNKFHHFGYEHDGLPEYPFFTLEPTRPGNRYSWYYWLDTRVLPTKDLRGSAITLETAREMMRR